MATITVCIAPRLVKLELAKEFEEKENQAFPDNYITIYQKAKKQDDSWETIYHLGVYKQIGWYPVRGEKNLNEILDFIKEKNPGCVQVVNTDKQNIETEN